MKILLVANHTSVIDENRMMPLSIYSIAGLLRENNHEVGVFDPLWYANSVALEEGAFLKEAQKYEVIGFSVNSFGWGYALTRIKRLRELGFDGIIVCGGVHATSSYKQVLSDSTVDYVVLGECEKSFPLLLQALSKKDAGNVEDVPGIAYWKNGEIQVNKVAPLMDLTREVPPLPAYDLAPEGFYGGYSFEASRGCFGSCTFCSITYQKCWRGYKPVDVVERLLVANNMMKGKTFADKIFVTDDCFIMKNDWAMDVLNRIKEAGMADGSFCIESRARNLIDGDMLSILTEFPNIYIQVGIESGYDSTLKRINKGITVDDIMAFAGLTYEYGLSNSIFLSFIIGFPWEEADDCIKTLEFAAFLKDKYGFIVNCSWWLPVPSKIWDDHMKGNVDEDYFLKINWAYDSDLFFKTHPLLTVIDFERINSLIEVYNSVGLKLK